MTEDFMGNQEGYKGVTTADIPSLENKIYDYPINENGGITAKQGIFADPVAVAHAETLTPDNTLSGKNLKPVIVVGIGIVLLWIILVVSK